MFKVSALHGFNIVRVRGTIAQIATATSTATTITAPAGIIAGDLLVLLDKGLNALATAPVTVIATGFTSISNITASLGASGIRQILSYKLADGSEGGASLTGLSGNLRNKALYTFRQTPAAIVANVGSVNGEITAGNPVAQTVTSGSGALPLVVIGGYASGSAIDPRTFSPAKDGELERGTGMYLAYKIYNAEPADVTIDMDDEGADNELQSCYISLS